MDHILQVYVKSVHFIQPAGKIQNRSSCFRVTWKNDPSTNVSRTVVKKKIVNQAYKHMTSLDLMSLQVKFAQDISYY